MQLTTSLPFPHLTFKHWNLEGREVAVLIVKGTFGVQADGNLGVMSEQLPIAEVDVFWGDENASSLMAEQDLAPAKPKTDVVVNAVARAPNEKPLTEWPVSIEIKGRAFYEFYVRGPSQWHKERGKWRLGEPDADFIEDALSALEDSAMHFRKIGIRMDHSGALASTGGKPAMEMTAWQ